MKVQLLLALMASAAFSLCIGIDDGYDSTDGQHTAGGHTDDPATRQVWFSYDSSRSDNDTDVWVATSVRNGPWYIENMTYDVRGSDRGNLATPDEKHGVSYRDEAGPEDQIDIGDVITVEPRSGEILLIHEGRLVGGHYAEL